MTASTTTAVRFEIPAMDCAEEFRVIAQAVNELPGVENPRADYLSRVLTVDLDADHATQDMVADRLRDVGFPAIDPASANGSGSTATAFNPLFSRKAAIIAGTVLLALAFFAWLASLSSLAWCLGVASTLVSGWHVGLAAWKSARFSRIDMNTLMVIAASGAIALGEYFEAAVAMLLFGVSIWLESYSVGRAKKAVASLVGLMPQRARVIKKPSSDSGVQSRQPTLGGLVDEDMDDVDCLHVHKGDVIVVRPGERIAADGKVIDGSGSVDQSSITGESKPAAKTVGDGVFAGTLNGEAPLLVRATSCAHDSTLAGVAKLVDQARSSTSPTERFVDRFARIYTPSIIALACLIGVVAPIMISLLWAQPLGVHFATWFHRGLVLLVIACPCALVISTPVTIVCGLHEATRNGILVKGGDFLELAGQADSMIVDKTGTITEGRPTVSDVWCASGVTKEELLACAAALEMHSEHPLAVAIKSAANAAGVEQVAASEVTTIVGGGVVGKWNEQPAAIGNASLFENLAWTGCEDIKSYYAEVAEQTDGRSGTNAGSLLLVATESRPLGALLVTDVPREGAKAAVLEWRELGIKSIQMLSGDQPSVVEQVASQVGIDDAIGGLLPAEKFESLREMRAKGSRVIIIGDGVNDSPALAAADVGIAIENNVSDLALQSADVVLLAPRLGKVSDLIRLSRRTHQILWQNIAFAIGIKLFVLVLAAMGLATMWMAIVADVGASLLVIFNGMRVLTNKAGSSSRNRIV